MKGLIKLCKFKRIGENVAQHKAMLIIESADGGMRAMIHLPLTDLLRLEGATRKLWNAPFEHGESPRMASVEMEIEGDGK